MQTIQASSPGTAEKPIGEAILLPAGLLVAAHERGVFLLSPDGDERAHWDVPAYELAVADDGASALAVYGHRQTDPYLLNRIDLVTHRVTPVPPFHAYGVGRSFDGSSLTIATEDGLHAIDLTTGARLWSLLDSRGRSVDEHKRTATHLSAICTRERGLIRTVERWTWELPSLRALDRRANTKTWGAMFIKAVPVVVTGATADGTIVFIDLRDGELVECVQPLVDPEVVRPLDDYAEIAVDGHHSALLQEKSNHALVTFRERERHRPVGAAAFPGARSAYFGAYGDVATAYTEDGRIIAMDLRTRAVLANLKTL